MTAMLNIRGMVVLAAVALLSLVACESRAEESITPRHQRPPRITCQVVRDFVALVGPEKAEQMARGAGASEERLAAARRCIKDEK